MSVKVKTRGEGLFRSLIAIILSFSIGTQSFAITSSRTKDSLQSKNITSTAAQSEIQQNLRLAYWGALDLNHPQLVEFAFQKNHELDKVKWSVDQNSPLIDSDPFFLRAQRWVRNDISSELKTIQSGDIGDQLVFHTLALGGFVIQSAQSLYALKIDANLTPLLETHDYILLTAKSDSFFEQKIGSEGANDQGVFFINKKDFLAISNLLNQAARDGVNAHELLPVTNGLPIYFIPLPGKWAGVKVAFEWAMKDQYALYDQEKNPLLVDISDFHKLEELGFMNLQVARALELSQRNLTADTQAIYPLPGSTALFGLMMSGAAKRMKTQTASLFNFNFISSVLPRAWAEETTGPAASTNATAASDAVVSENDTLSLQQQNSSPSWYQRFKEKYLPHVLPTTITAAQIGAVWYTLAHSTGGLLIPPDMLPRIETAAQIIGGSYLAAIALKLTVYKSFYKKKYPKVEGQSALQRAWVELKSHLDILPYNTFLVDQTPMLTVFNSANYSLDRFLSQHKLLRTLYDNTFGWVNEQRSSIPVNWRTTLLGLAEGHAASLTVATSLLVFYPWYFNSIGMSLSGSTAGALAASFVSSEIIRVYFDYFRSGAQSYTAATRVSLRAEAQKEADNALKTMGLNPDARTSRKIRKEMTDELLNKKLVSRKMADQAEFKFDFNSLVARFFGYFGVNADNIKTMNPEVLEKNHFIFENGRWGLMLPSLQLALKRAQQVLRDNPDSATGKNVVKTLKWAISRFGYAEAFMRESSKPRPHLQFRRDEFFSNPAGYLLQFSRDLVSSVASDALERGRDVRKVLWLASTSGDPDEIFQVLPNSWVNVSNDQKAARLAAELVHYSIHSLHDKNDKILQPATDDMKMFTDEAHAKLRDQGYDGFEYRLRYDQTVSDMVAARAEDRRIHSHNPLQLNWYERYQYQEGIHAAEAYVREAIQSPENKATETLRFEFAKAIAGQMGLYLKSREGSDLVRRAADSANKNIEELLSTPIEIKFLEKLDARERVFYEAWVYTKEFLHTYVSLATEADTYLEYGSPERPGRLQFVRRALVHAPGYKQFFLPCILAIETFFKNDSEAYSLGLKGHFSRWPILPDVYSSVGRMLRTYPYAITAGYGINVAFFQSTLTWPQSVFFSSLYALALYSVEISNRLMNNFNLHPMKNLSSRLMYTYVLSWLVSVRYVPVLGYGSQFDSAMRTAVINPIKSVWAEVIQSPVVTSAISACARLLGGG